MKEKNMSKDDFIKSLRKVAQSCHSTDDCIKKMKEEFPGVAITITYDPSGRMFLGMAMSHYHKGVISF